MILVFDIYYFNGKVKIVCLEFEKWNESKNFKIYIEIIDNIEEYISGEFYRREFLCIMSLLN